MHLTISVDGPEPVHDMVRGVPGTFQRIKDGVSLLSESGSAERKQDQPFDLFHNQPISITAAWASCRMWPAASGLGSIAIVPYYYFPDSVGHHYAEELHNLGCSAFSWVGFHHEDSGVDFVAFQEQYRQYLDQPRRCL